MSWVLTKDVVHNISWLHVNVELLHLRCHNTSLTAYTGELICTAVRMREF